MTDSDATMLENVTRFTDKSQGSNPTNLGVPLYNLITTIYNWDTTIYLTAIYSNVSGYSQHCISCRNCWTFLHVNNFNVFIAAMPPGD